MERTKSRYEDHIYLGETTYHTPVYIHKMWMACLVRVHGHEAKYHYMNGYSCIDKHIVPGLSARASIQANHKLALHHNDSAAGKNAWHKDPARQNNPFSQDNKQCRKMSEKYIYDLSAGKLKEVKVITFGLDMVIKGALLTGGEALVIAPCNGRPEVPAHIRGICPDPVSMELFWNTLVEYRDKSLEEWLSFVDKNFKLYMWKTDRVIKLFKESKIKIYLYSQLPDAVVLKGGFIPEHDPQKWINERAARQDGKIWCVDEANKLCVLGKGDSN